MQNIAILENIKPLDLQVTVIPVVTFLLLRPNRGGTLRITAGAYHPISSAYAQQKRMRRYIICHKMCGLASSKTRGSGLMGAPHPSATGNPISLTTLKVKIVLLLYSKTKGSGMTSNAKANVFLFVVGVSCCITCFLCQQSDLVEFVF